MFLGAPLEGQSKPVRARIILAPRGLAENFLKRNLGPIRSGSKRLIKAFNDLSKHVHGRADTIVHDRDEQEGEAEAAIGAVEELLHAYHAAVRRCLNRSPKASTTARSQSF